MQSKVGGGASGCSRLPCAPRSSHPIGFAYAAGFDGSGPGKGADAAAAFATESPIKHVIILIGENRGLDHTFGVYKPKGKKADDLQHSVQGHRQRGRHAGAELTAWRSNTPSRRSRPSISAPPNSAKTPYNTTTNLMPQPNTNGAPTAPHATTGTRPSRSSRRRADIEPAERESADDRRDRPADRRARHARSRRRHAAARPLRAARAQPQRRRLHRRHDAPLLPGVAAAGLQPGQRDEGQSDRLPERSLSRS